MTTEKDYEEFLELLNKHNDRKNQIRSKKLSNRAQDKADIELLLSDE